MFYKRITITFYVVFIFFFFQAEDGIRDLVRSRGLGDVYKRQILNLGFSLQKSAPLDLRVNTFLTKRNQVLEILSQEGIAAHETPYSPVSYTHLTLPTSDLV